MSPRYQVPSYRRNFAEFQRRYAIRTDNFTVVGSLARGGLSNTWATGVCRFDDDDLADFPISLNDLRRSYQNVTQRIGVSGTNEDDLSDFHGYEESLQPPLASSGHARLLYERYCSRSESARRRGVSIGHTRMATLTRDHQGRHGCVYCGLCAYGCASESMWSAKYDLDKLLRFPNFNYRDGAFVSHLRRLDASYMIGISPDQHSVVVEEVKTKRVILASGAIGSARLVLDALKMHNESRPLLSSPGAAFALLVPRWRIGNLIDEDVLGTAQLSYCVATPNSVERYAFGYISLADIVNTAELLAHMPFSYPLSRRIARRLQPILLLGIIFLGGGYSCNKMRVSLSGDLEISGGYISTTESTTKTAVNRLAGTLFRCGAYLIPGSITMRKLGEDVHYAGTVPMRAAPCIGEANSQGEVQGLPGVYVVDGSALTALPSKAHTLTIMANADRIATAIAAAQPG